MTPPVQATTELLALLDGLLDPFFAVDVAWRYTYVNRHAAAIMGVTPEALLGRVLWECFPEALGTALDAEYRHVMAAREVREFETFSPALGVWLEVRAFPHGSGLAAHFRDVTARRLADDRRGALLGVTQALAGAGSEREVVEAALATGLPALGAYGGTLLRVEDGGEALEVLQTTGYDDERARAWKRFPLTVPLPATDAFRQVSGVFVRERELLTRYPALAPAKAARTRAVCALPLMLNGQATGVLTLSFDADRTFNAAERDFAMSLAGQLAQALARARAADERERDRAQLSAVLDQLPAAVWIAALPGGEVISRNAAIGRILRQGAVPGPPGEAVPGEDVGFHPDGRRYASHEWPLARTVATGERVEDEEIEVRRGDGTRGFVRYTSTLVRGGRGDPGVAVVTGVDVTELRELNEALEARVARRTGELRARNADLAAETAALSAFASFTELVGRETDLGVLTQAAASVLHQALGDGSTGYYELEDGRWKQRVWDGDMEEGTLDAAQAGFPQDVPLFAQPAATREAHFVAGWRAREDDLARHTPEYGAVAVYPVVVGGRVLGQLAAALRQREGWDERDRQILGAVGRALALAAERADSAEQLRAQGDELEARARTLEAFAALTSELTSRVAPPDLVGRAQDTVLGLLPEGISTYYELQGGLWQLQQHRGALGEALVAALRVGRPRGSWPNLDRPFETRAPYYQEHYDPDTSNLPRDSVARIGATATLPVLVGDEVRGVFVVGLFGRHTWGRAARATLEAAAQALGLALRRAGAEAELARSQLLLEQRNAELHHLNRELEAFSHSVSHDLRAPLRHILGFAGMLRRTLPTGADERSGRFLDLIEGGAQAASTLTEQLLVFAKSATQPMTPQEVDLAALVAEVRAQVSNDAQGRAVTWRVAPLPPVTGDAALLRQVLVNLLENAVKYTRPRGEALIEVWAQQHAGEVWVFVRDNGVGFDPQYAGKLFGTFQRLHRADEFEGTGVGLANVRRIVERHGGQVAASAVPGEGATFSFSLPTPARLP